MLFRGVAASARASRRRCATGLDGEDVAHAQGQGETGVTGGNAPRVRPYVGKAVITGPGRTVGTLADPDDPEAGGPSPPEHPVLPSDPTGLSTQSTPPPQRGEPSLWATEQEAAARW